MVDLAAVPFEVAEGMDTLAVAQLDCAAAGSREQSRRRTHLDSPLGIHDGPLEVSQAQPGD